MSNQADDLYEEVLQEEDIVEEGNTLAEGITEELEDEDPDVPSKFRGKQKRDIIESYKELESAYGRQGQEFGELRSTVDKLIARELERSDAKELDELEAELDFYEKPKESIEVVLNQKLKPLQEDLAKTRLELNQERFENRHPDADEIVKSKEFVQYLEENLEKKERFIQADRNWDFSTAGEILSDYKRINKQIKDRQERSEKNETDASNLSGVGSPVASSDRGGKRKPIFNRAKLIRLKNSNPRRYDELKHDIYEAYREGRVV
jgi:hypothetical protein